MNISESETVPQTIFSQSRSDKLILAKEPKLALRIPEI